MKQTAVEWLVDESMKLVIQYMQGTLNENTLDDVIHEITTKAKQIEKDQIMDAYTHDRFLLKISAEQYYNETFKSE